MICLYAPSLSFALNVLFFFFSDTATTGIYTLSLHDALPISGGPARRDGSGPSAAATSWPSVCRRSEEHTSELQSRFELVCRLLLEKNNYKYSSTFCFDLRTILALHTTPEPHL